MFIGHFGLGLAGKSITSKTSLGTWFLSVQLLDGLWPLFLLLGWEHVRIAPGITKFTPLDFYDYPISHSLLTSIFWSILFGVIYFIFRRNVKSSILLGLGVVSHWVLDFIVHRPDLPILPGRPWVAGFSLWNHPIATMLLEIPIFLSGIILYFRSTRPKDKIGKYALWSLLIFFIIVYVMGPISPPPPSVNAIAWVGMTGWLMMAYAYWVDSHRTSRTV